MKVLIFIVVLAIASWVFYLFIRKAFDMPLDQTKGNSGQVKIKPVGSEEVKRDESLKQGTYEEEVSQLPQPKAEDGCCKAATACRQRDEEEMTQIQE